MLRIAIRFVNLVDNNNWLQVQSKGFFKHKTCLRHRAFKSIHNKQNTVSHIEHALHFSSEIGVTRSVDDVYFKPFVANRNILRQNRNPALTLKIVAVKNQFAHVLIVAE
ncbi:hypothetical protein DSECCO2_605710 [anaerobic digester metagenome]